MPPNITLLGNNYFLCTGTGGNIAGASDSWFYDALQHGPGITHIYIALGEGDSYFVAYKTTDGTTRWSWSLREHYRGLADHLDQKVRECPTFVSLGENGRYFCRSPWGNSWSLPADADEFVDNADDDDPVEAVWLGKDNAYVAKKRSSRTLRNLRGNYGSLDQKLKYRSGDIRVLALNLRSSSSYCAIFSNGEAVLNPGSTGLTMGQVQEWVRSV